MHLEIYLFALSMKSSHVSLFTHPLSFSMYITWICVLTWIMLDYLQMYLTYFMYEEQTYKGINGTTVQGPN